MGVDEIVEDTVKFLEERNLWNNTYREYCSTMFIPKAAMLTLL